MQPLKGLSQSKRIKNTAMPITKEPLHNLSSRRSLSRNPEIFNTKKPFQCVLFRCVCSRSLYYLGSTISPIEPFRDGEHHENRLKDTGFRPKSCRNDNCFKLLRKPDIPYVLMRLPWRDWNNLQSKKRYVIVNSYVLEQLFPAT